MRRFVVVFHEPQGHVEDVDVYASSPEEAIAEVAPYMRLDEVTPDGVWVFRHREPDGEPRWAEVFPPRPYLVHVLLSNDRGEDVENEFTHEGQHPDEVLAEVLVRYGIYRFLIDEEREEDGGVVYSVSDPDFPPVRWWGEVYIREVR